MFDKFRVRSVVKVYHKTNQVPTSQPESELKVCKPEVLLMVNVWFSNASMLAERNRQRRENRAALALLTSF